MAQAGKPGGGVSGKPGGGLGGLGGGSTPMTAEQAAAANGTRNQNLFTTVGGLSRPSAPGKPAARPSGPAGPPKPTPAGPPLPRQRPTLDPKVLDPLISGSPLTGTAGALGEGTTGFGPPGSPGVGYPEGFAYPALPAGAAPPSIGPEETIRRKYKPRTDLTGKSY